MTDNIKKYIHNTQDKGDVAMQESCIFCKILKEEIPSFTVYEDDLFRVILDRFPAVPGHVLIIPKLHHENIFDMPANVATSIYPLARKMARVIKEAMGADGINVIQNNGAAAGQAVFHFHLHIVPRYMGDGVQLNSTSNGETTLEELALVAEKIKKVLEY